jgi:hypothetical protein
MHDAEVTRHAPQKRLHVAVLVGGLVVLTLAAGPVLGVDPSPAPKGPPVFAANFGAPGQAPKPEKSKVPTTPITVTGTVTAAMNADGRTTYSIASGGKTYTLEVGPPWWWVDDHPLADHVGHAVTIVGEIAQGSTEIEVETVDGASIRTWIGRPPWAGGPKAAGARHPGWKGWSGAHSDGHPGLGLGRAHAPGQLKKAARAEASPSPAPSP